MTHTPTQLPHETRAPDAHHRETFVEQIFERYNTLARKYFRHSEVEAKKDGSALTQMDQEANTFIVRALREELPQHGVLSEEEAQHHNPDAPWQWVLDPVDGTVSFACGYPAWGLGLGLLHHGEPVEGYMRFPLLDENYVATPNGCYFNGTLMHPPQRNPIPDMRNCILDSLLHEELPMKAFRSMKLRIFGSSLYHLACVSLGRAEAMISSRVRLWDIAAGLPFTRAMGLVECYLDGSPLDMKALLHSKEHRLAQPLIVGSEERVNDILERLQREQG